MLQMRNDPVICAAVHCKKRKHYSDGYCHGHHRRAERGQDMIKPLGELNSRPKDTETHSFCVDCKEYKLRTQFGKAIKNSNGLQEFCAECRTWRSTWYRYGLSKDDWLAMFDDQDGLCALCGDALAYRRPGHKVVTDHCHESQLVRGITCPRCNVGLGLAEVVGLQKMQDYIDRAVRARESNSG